MVPQVSISEGSSASLTLMTLPAEIRNRIYVLVLGPEHDQNIYTCPLSLSRAIKKIDQLEREYPMTNADKYCSIPHPKASQLIAECKLDILLVCRQIYIEAFHVYYSSNFFYFPDTELLFFFLQGIGYARRQQIKMIFFDWRGKYAKDAFRLLKTCKMLKTVYFTLPCSEPPGYAAIREVRGLDQALVHTRVHYEIPYDIGKYDGYRGSYGCHCQRLQRFQNGGPLGDIQRLECDMMRPRLAQYAFDPAEKFDLFKSNRKSARISEAMTLCDDEIDKQCAEYLRRKLHI